MDNILQLQKEIEILKGESLDNYQECIAINGTSYRDCMIYQSEVVAYGIVLMKIDEILEQK